MTADEAARVLGLPLGSDVETVRRRVRELAAVHHPDKGPPSEVIERTGRMHLITEASRAIHTQPVTAPDARRTVRRDNVRDLAGAGSVVARACGVPWLADVLAHLHNAAKK